MKGLVIWAYSECRSMMGLHSAIQRIANFPVVIATYHHHSFKNYFTARTATGFCSDEFSDVKLFPIGENYDAALKVMNSCQGYYHLFAAYQGVPNYRRIMREVIRRGEHYGIISEAPCNMTPGLKGWLKEHVYYRLFLPFKVRQSIRNADFFLNLSGNDTRMLRRIGWEGRKIIPWGYYSPAIPNSECKPRTSNRDFHILVSGIMSWHRSPDVIMRALQLLSTWGVNYRATFTQNGPMLPKLQKIAVDNKLPVEFTGFLPMTDLIKLYETCSVYVAAGRREPWGMRLNDALQCGAPLVVSRGMGGVKMVDDYGCGIGFNNEDYVDLAHRLKQLATDATYYEKVSNAAKVAAQLITPENKARELVAILKGIWG